MKYVESAELLSYNANNRGTRTTDCVNRALSAVFDIPYYKVNQDLNKKKKELRAYSYKIQDVYGKLIQEYGGPEHPVKQVDPITLNDFVDTVASSGTWIVTTGKSAGTHDHLVAVIDGTVWDSWDSRNQYVYNYYEIGQRDRKQVTDIKSIRNSLIHYAGDVCTNYINILFKKYGWENPVIADLDGIGTGYNITLDFVIKLTLDDNIRRFPFEITFVFTPTMTEDEAKETIEKTAKVRTYDRLYAINQKVKSLQEEAEQNRQLGNEKSFRPSLYNTQEVKFYESLPGWVKASLVYLFIWYPGQYSDSYRIKIKPLPGDPYKEQHLKDNNPYSQDGVLEFSGYTATQIKDELDRYKKKYEVPYSEYDPSDEY